MAYDALFNQMSEVVKTLHSIDRSLDIIAKDIEKENQKWSSTNDIMKKYFWKFFKPKNKEYTPYWESIADKIGESWYKPFTPQDIDDAMNKSRDIVNQIYDEAHKLRY